LGVRVRLAGQVFEAKWLGVRVRVAGAVGATSTCSAPLPPDCAMALRGCGLVGRGGVVGGCVVGAGIGVRLGWLGLVLRAGRGGVAGSGRAG
jgi:hypothetical protein